MKGGRIIGRKTYPTQPKSSDGEQAGDGLPSAAACAKGKKKATRPRPEPKCSPVMRSRPKQILHQPTLNQEI
jgi:hypothetical protein